VASWEGELDHEKLRVGLDRDIDPTDIEVAVTTG
jgi:aerobic C4-dicarboxylate transport protein